MTAYPDPDELNRWIRAQALAGGLDAMVWNGR
jgi:hypothetical protein